MTKTVNNSTHRVQLTSERPRQHHLSKTINRDDFPHSEGEYIEVSDDAIVIEGTEKLMQWLYTTLLQQTENPTENRTQQANDIASGLASHIENTVDITLTHSSEHLPEN